MNCLSPWMTMCFFNLLSSKKYLEHMGNLHLKIFGSLTICLFLSYSEGSVIRTHFLIQISSCSSIAFLTLTQHYIQLLRTFPCFFFSFFPLFFFSPFCSVQFVYFESLSYFWRVSLLLLSSYSVGRIWAEREFGSFLKPLESVIYKFFNSLFIFKEKIPFFILKVKF